MHRTDLAFLVAIGALTIVACSPRRPGEEHPAALALGEVSLHPELELELAAAEPLVFDPVDLEFDEHGRAFVLEMPGFPIVADDQEPPGRIVELIDRDLDGAFDERRLFADRFRYADSILPHRGGLLVADAPELLYVKDTDGDGAADLRQVLLVGFGEGQSESNFNGLRWGPDNWVHGANGSSGGAVHRPGRPEAATGIRGRDFRFRLAPLAGDPDRLEAVAFETTSRMGGGFGLDFDDWGRRFVTHEQRHIQVEVFPARYLTGPHPWPSTVTEISDHGTGATARVFPISETEARPNHPEQAGYFTAGCGLTHYGGGALPERFRGAFFVAEAVHNLVHVDRVEPAGASFVAKRDRPRQEVLALADNAFRPDNFAVGPEGALYVLDIHRGVIEHPEWIPDEIEAGLDLRAGEDQGRVLRLVPSGGLGPVTPSFDRGHPAAAIAALEHDNQWWRLTAQRLLVEWAEPETIPGLQDLAGVAADPRARLHALWTLDGLGALDVERVISALADSSPRVREGALRLAEPFLPDPAIARRILDATRDGDARVALQATLTLGVALDADPDLEPPNDALAALAHRLGDDPWMALAIEATVARRPATLAPSLVTRLSEATRLDESSRALIESVAAIVGDRRRADEHLELLEAARAGGPATAAEPARRAVLAGLAAGAQRSGDGAPTASTPTAVALRDALAVFAANDRDLADALRVARAFGLRLGETALARAAAARTRATNRDLSSDERRAALELLELVEPADPGSRVDLLVDLLSPGEPAAVQNAAIDQLGRADPSLVAPRLIAAWRIFGPTVRRRAGDLLLYRRESHERLLDALESGTIGVGELMLDLERRRTLLRSPTPGIGERAARLFGDEGVSTRREAYEALLPSLELAGDAERGKVHFQELCSRCHRLGEVGVPIGPDLTDVFRKSAESLLHDLVDPNAAVGPEHVGYVVRLDDGEVVTGLIDEDEDGIRIRSGVVGEDPSGRFVPRARIAELRSTGLSLMPEGLEAGLDAQDVADLLAFLERPR